MKTTYEDLIRETDSLLQEGFGDIRSALRGSVSKQNMARIREALESMSIGEAMEYMPYVIEGLGDSVTKAYIEKALEGAIDKAYEEASAEAMKRKAREFFDGYIGYEDVTEDEMVEDWMNSGEYEDAWEDQTKPMGHEIARAIIEALPWPASFYTKLMPRHEDPYMMGLMLSGHVNRDAGAYVQDMDGTSVFRWNNPQDAEEVEASLSQIAFKIWEKTSA